jgi:hypothetical protein
MQFLKIDPKAFILVICIYLDKYKYLTCMSQIILKWHKFYKQLHEN